MENTTVYVASTNKFRFWAGDDNGYGKVVSVQSMVGAETSDSTTRPNNTDAYAAGDVVGENPAANLQFDNVIGNSGGTFVVLGARIRIDVNAIPAGMTGFRLHLYDAAPTGIADNAVYNLPSGDRAKYLGYVNISTLLDVGDTVWGQDDNINFTGKLAASSTTLYGILQTIGAYTPAAETVHAIILNVAGV